MIRLQQKVEKDYILKLKQKDGSWYYILDGIASLVAGYLFVFNNYLPIFIGLGFSIIATILALRFKDIYEVERKEKKFGILKKLNQYKNDLRISFKFIFRSKRMKAYLLFQIVIYSLITVIDIYGDDLLVNIRNTRRTIFNDTCISYINSGECLFHLRNV